MEEAHHSIDDVLPPPSLSEKLLFSAHGREIDATEDFSALREAVRPVTHKELEETMELLKYDIHQELQEEMREQVRQFTIAKEETALLIMELGKQLKVLARANKELREENSYLRHIY